MNFNEASYDGYKAAEAKKPFTTNPHAAGTEPYRDWNAGYIRGFEDTNGVKFPCEGAIPPATI